MNQSTSSSNNNALDHHTHSADGDGDGSYNRRSNNDDNNITLVSSTTPAGGFTELNTASAASNNSIPTFAVKDVVDVASRTGPGMNKQGGSARITKVHASGVAYDVNYIIGGGREKNVDQVYITRPVPEDDQKRDRARAAARHTRVAATRSNNCNFKIGDVYADGFLANKQHGKGNGVLAINSMWL